MPEARSIHLHLRAQATALAAACATLDGIPGIDRVISRIGSEQQQIESLERDATPARLQGIENNITGISAELAAINWALPNVTAVQLAVHTPCGSTSASVDVVADGGRVWIEAKATLTFSVGSSACTALLEQCRRLVECSETHFVGAHHPRVVVFFASSCSSEVAAALASLGVHVVLPSNAPQQRAARSIAAAAAEQPPAMLDAGTLLALCADSCHHPPDHPGLRAWAKGNEHWRRSLAEEVEDPLLPRLTAALDQHASWLIRQPDMERCAAIFAMAAGDAEWRRWRTLCEDKRVRVISTERCAMVAGPSLGLDVGDAAGDVNCDHDTPPPTTTATAATASAGQRQLHASFSAEAAALAPLRGALERARVPAAQRALLLLAAAIGARVFTSNGKLLRKLAPHVRFPCWLHEARWLSGLGEGGGEGDGEGDDADDTVKGRSPSPIIPTTTVEEGSSHLQMLPPELLVHVLLMLSYRQGFHAVAATAPACSALRAAARALPVVRIVVPPPPPPPPHTETSSPRHGSRHRPRVSSSTPTAIPSAELQPWRSALLQCSTALRALHVRDWTLNDASIGWICTHILPWRCVTTLTLMGHLDGAHEMGPDGAEALGTAIRACCATGLTSFELSNAKVGVSGARSLAGAIATATSLRTLCLRHCGLLKEDLRAVVSGLCECPSLERLSLARNRFGHMGARQLAEWLLWREARPDVAALRELDLSTCAFGDLGGACIATVLAGSAARARFCAAVTAGEIVGPMFRDAQPGAQPGTRGWNALVGYAIATVTELTEFATSQADAQQQRLAPPPELRVSLRRNGICGRGAYTFAQLLHCRPPIAHLDLSRNPFEPSSLNAVATVMLELSQEPDYLPPHLVLCPLKFSFDDFREEKDHLWRVASEAQQRALAALAVCPRSRVLGSRRRAAAARARPMRDMSTAR